MLRTIVIWLLALAIPAQGMAMAAMMHCGSAHHSPQAAQGKVQPLPDVAQAALAKHAAHGHVGHLAPDARMANDTGQTAASSDASGSAQPDKLTDPVKVASSTYQKCSACASCCAGAALPSMAVMAPTFDPAREVTVFSLSTAADVVVDGPERPPRILRA